MGRRSSVGALLLGATLLTSDALAQESRAAVAVLPFVDGGSYGQDKESFQALESGIQAMLLAELGRNPAVRIVERSTTRRLLGGQDLGARGQVDAATAAKVGRAAGARYTVFGSFVDLYGRFRLNARIVDVESGEILRVVSNDDPKLQDRQHLHQIIQLVGSRILAGAGVPAIPTDGSRIVPTDVLTLYSRGLLHEDRGERDRAADFYRKALDAFPEFTEARDALRRVTS